MEIMEVKKSHCELDEWRKRQEILWRQKSRELLLTPGDRNTKFFHAATIANRRRLYIPALKDEQGTWQTSQVNIGKVLIDEFTKFFLVEDLRRSERLGDFFQECISKEENSTLEAILTKAEI